jgi:HEAT repeat protein
LGRIGEPANVAIPSLNKLLESRDPHEKTVAAWALVHIAPNPEIKKVALPVLVAALHGDRNPHIRRQVAETLGEIGQDSPLAKEALQVALRDSDEAVREAANKAVTSLK